MQKLAIKNAKYFNKEGEIYITNLLIDNGLISDISCQHITSQYEILDANDNFVVPGFIDLQVYGAAGKLFSAYPTVETLISIENELLEQGTTGFFICVATNTDEVMIKAIEAVKAHRHQAKNCLGLHLEGPYLNPSKKGAHVEECIKKADLAEVKALIEYGEGVIKMITLAPELQDDEVIEYLLAQGIIVSLGHSDANYAQATRAYDMGVQTTTHLYNAMSPILHRTPGIPTAVFNHKSAMASIIADGHHVDYQVIKTAYKLMKDRLFLITDAVTTCEIGPYKHQLRGDKYVMPNGTLSGSALSMLQAVKNCVAHCDIPLADALNMASAYPAKVLNKENEIGLIAVDNSANLLLLDMELNLIEVIYKGEKV
jgi:N-acetylglucosamine-6-phosphate deacetylase